MAGGQNTPGETGDSQIAESNVTSKPLHKGATLDQRAAIKNANRDKHREDDDSKTSTPPPISAATTEITETPSNSPGTGGTGSSPHSHGQVPISTADPSTDATRTNPPSSSAYGTAVAVSPGDFSSHGQQSLVSIKIMVSNNVAGSIIGRSGQTISDLQLHSSSRIKLSQAGDYYPGTSDRVCLIQGGESQVKLASSMVLQRIYNLQRSSQQHQQHHQVHDAAAPQAHPHGLSVTPMQSTDMQGQSVPSSAGFAIRILVPSTSCGMIIGRGGSNIKSMAETSGVTSIRLSPKDNESVYVDNASTSAGSIVAATAERIVTISGPNLQSTIGCIGLIINGMASHPDIGRYSNMTTSYTRAANAVSAAQHAAAATMQQHQQIQGYALAGPLPLGSLLPGTNPAFMTGAPLGAPTMPPSAPQYVQGSPPSRSVDSQHFALTPGGGNTDNASNVMVSQVLQEPPTLRYVSFPPQATGGTPSPAPSDGPSTLLIPQSPYPPLGSHPAPMPSTPTDRKSVV